MDEKYDSIELDLLEGIAKLKVLVSLLKISFEEQRYPGAAINALCVIQDQIALLEPAIETACAILEKDADWKTETGGLDK